MRHTVVVKEFISLLLVCQRQTQTITWQKLRRELKVLHQKQKKKKW